MTTMDMDMKRLAKKRAAKDNKREGHEPDMPEPKDRSGAKVRVDSLTLTEDTAKPAGEKADFAYNSKSERDRRSDVSRAGRGSDTRWRPVLEVGEMEVTSSDYDKGDPNRSRSNKSSDKSKRKQKFRMVDELLGYMDKMDNNGNGIPDDEE